MTVRDEEITRVIMENVPDWLATTFYALAFAAIGWAAWRFWRRMRRRHSGRALPQPKSERTMRAGITQAAAYLAFHWQLLKSPYAGVAHLLTFYGFAILFVGTCLVFLEHDTPLHFFYGRFYEVASLVIDLGGVAFLVGLGMFLWQRHRSSPTRVLGEWWVAALTWLLFAIGTSGFLLEGARIARDFPPFEKWSAVGYGVAVAMRWLGLSAERAPTLHRLLWGGHAALCVGFFALLPWKFFSHMVYGLVSWSARSPRPAAALRTISLDWRLAPGASRPREFARHDLLEADACTTCGRCNEVCPAHAAGKPLRPRDIVLGVRQALDLSLDEPLANWIADEALWSCTTCAACNQACPVGIDVYGKIIELRRGRVEAGDVPLAAEELFAGVADRFNPYRKENQDRIDWAGDLPVAVAAADEPIELLYWVGCAGSFDPDGQPIARAMIKILNHLKINYRVLGKRERCTGDPARRLGEEGLFQELARGNLATVNRHRVSRILTHCPHCFNTWRNEYPLLDQHAAAGQNSPQVVHHSEFLAELVNSGRIPRDGRRARVRMTFHDPCYLGRGNDQVDPPRAVAAATGADLAEMPRHGRDSFCCGAGGGSMWLDVRGDERIENLRFREAAATGAETVVTACPFCKTMLEAARTAGGSAAESTVRRVKDLAELVVESLGL